MRRFSTSAIRAGCNLPMENVFAHFAMTYFQEKGVHLLAATCDTMCARLGYCFNTRPSLPLSMRICLTFLVVLLCRPCLQRMTRRFTLSLEDKGLLKFISMNCSLFMTFISHKLPHILTTITDKILKPLTSTGDATTFYTHGMDVSSWLSGATPRPSTPYFASIPISHSLRLHTAHPISCRVPCIWTHSRQTL